MTATNDYKQYAGGSGANAETQAGYLADTTLIDGMSSGVVPSSRLNKIFRQATMASAALGQIIANAGVNILDDGDVSNFAARLLSAFNNQTRGSFLGSQYLTANGTYVVSTNNPSYIIVEVWGGGGGGGGSGASGKGGGGGGAGGYSKMKILASSLLATEGVSIGVGGVAGTSSLSGGSGGASSFGTHLSSTGGQGGAVSTSAVSSQGGVGGTGSGGDLNLTGNAGGINNFSSGLGGYGGAASLGGSGSVPAISGSGSTAANNSGSGGTGGSGTSVNGGAGGSGLVIIHEYS